MHQYKTPLIDEWPVMSFKELEEIEVEGKALRLFYKSFFVVLRLPEIAAHSFIDLLTADVQ